MSRRRNTKSGKPQRTLTKDAMFKNAQSWMQYHDKLCELAISMFEWKNLPDTIDPRFLEMQLFLQGQILFFKDEVMGYLALPFAGGGGFNIYNIPTVRQVTAPNGYNNRFTIDDSVIIYNNLLKKNSTLDMEIFSRRLAEFDQIIDVNCKAQKTPVLILCDEQQRLTMQNLYMQYDGNQPFIFGDKSLNPNQIKSINTGAPYIADKMSQMKVQVWNEALTYLGISNINVQKKERLITDEVTRNQGGTIASRYSRLEARRNACNEINRMFPELDVWCDFREDFQSIENEEDTIEGEPDSDGNGGTVDGTSTESEITGR
jgi:hypothetical protein